VIMGLAALVAMRGLKRGVQDDAEALSDREGQVPGDEPDAVYRTAR